MQITVTFCFFSALAVWSCDTLEYFCSFAVVRFTVMLSSKITSFSPGYNMRVPKQYSLCAGL